MALTPMPRFNKVNWHHLHNEQCKSLLSKTYSTLLIGDSIIAGLSRYRSVWKSYFDKLDAINCGIGGDRVEHVLWRCKNLPSHLSLRNAVIICGTNNIEFSSPNDIVDGIIEIGLSLRRKNSQLNVFVCGLLPRNDSWSVNRVYVKEVNDLLCYKCDLNGISFIKQDDWISHDGSLKRKLFYRDNLHLIEEGNVKLSKSISDAINPNNHFPKNKPSLL